MTTFPASHIQGYTDFKKGRFADESERYRRLADEGQSPESMVITCCDSRVAPEMIFNAAPGEIFVVRNVANLVPANTPDGEYRSTAAAVEFAVQGLKVKHIIVLGHGRCGGIKAALEPASEPLSPGDHIGKWVELLTEAADSVTANKSITAAERQTTLERLSIRNSIENLRTFPYIAALENTGELSLHGAWFDISGGELWTLNPETGDFEPTAADA